MSRGRRKREDNTQIKEWEKSILQIRHHQKCTFSHWAATLGVFLPDGKKSKKYFQFKIKFKTIIKKKKIIQRLQKLNHSVNKAATAACSEVSGAGHQILWYEQEALINIRSWRFVIILSWSQTVIQLMLRPFLPPGTREAFVSYSTTCFYEVPRNTTSVKPVLISDEFSIAWWSQKAQGGQREQTSAPWTSDK